MSLKHQIINEIIETEGGYINDPSDSGGETKYGVTVKVARKFGYFDPMEDMPRFIAFEVYSEKYWEAVRGDSLLSISEGLAREVCDTGVNMGPNRAITFLQRALNAFNMRGEIYDDLVVDGKIGQKTILAVKSYLKHRHEGALIKALNCLQGAFYIELSERREKDEKFIYGWFRNRIKI